ncbi:MAG: nonribosomal peptide synthetase MxaA [Ancylobacter novellus]|uniref:Nonribosomal peptide synthetase MxaA n=1 Tax=Ancylobacter novellus TaxID=921 RepID=A0A2W5R008_ANCNO|nr:MAG: nonribosomal peptide synthetase MxaA [Ancylobacter novellus]
MTAPLRLFVLALALVAATPALAQLRSLDLYAPRPFGHVIGDTLELTVEIALDAPFRLDPASLPRPRALNYWLELNDVALVDDGVKGEVQRYTLNLTYQTFYAPLEPRRLDIPAMALTAMDGDRRIELRVPAWSFLMSPLREIVSTGAASAMTPRPDLAPRPIPTGRTRLGLTLALAGALAALAALAWQLGWPPFGRRARRPFAQAARAVQASLPGASDPPSPSAYRSALLALHRAFDATAGRGVFTEDLPGFFAAHPAFATVEKEVQRLFAASRRVFFGEDAAGATGELPPGELVALARRLRAVERGSA